MDGWPFKVKIRSCTAMSIGKKKSASERRRLKGNKEIENGKFCCRAKEGAFSGIAGNASLVNAIQQSFAQQANALSTTVEQGGLFTVKEKTLYIYCIVKGII